MNIKKKIALAAIPAVMALSATDVSSKVLLMSDSMVGKCLLTVLLTHSITTPLRVLWKH